MESSSFQAKQLNSCGFFWLFKERRKEMFAIYMSMSLIVININVLNDHAINMSKYVTVDLMCLATKKKIFKMRIRTSWIFYFAILIQLNILSKDTTLLTTKKISSSFFLFLIFFVKLVSFSLFWDFFISFSLVLFHQLYKIYIVP